MQFICCNKETIHILSTGWPDIGYSFIIGEDGNIYDGRGWNTIGAHTYNHNYDGLGMQLYSVVSFIFQIYYSTFTVISNDNTIHLST